MNSLNFLPLSPDLIERGTVEKALVSSKEGYETAILKLGAHAKIKRHKHEKDNEQYVLPTGEIQVCYMGNKHELENPNDTEIFVISVKWP